MEHKKVGYLTHLKMLSCLRESERKESGGGSRVTKFQGKDKKNLALRVPAKCLSSW
jgi:hypothetical protein